jgi:hypothetical protein
VKSSFLILVFILILGISISAQEPTWSEPVKGLRARLLIYTSDKTDLPFYRVWIEMQNVSPFGGQMKIKYSPERTSFQVTDKSGKQSLERSPNPWSGQGAAGWEPTLLSWGGTIKFPINLHGTGYRLTDRAIIDMGPGQTWMISPDGTTYFLSGKLRLERQNGDHRYMDWSGTLELPSVEIPIRE